MTKPNQELELIPKSAAEKLDAHKKVIRSYINGHRKGAAEQFGYAFLAGRRLLQAKSEVPSASRGWTHKNGDSGFTDWVEKSFPDITVRTARRWMAFADSITAKISGVKTDTVSVLTNGGKLLLANKITPKDRATILKLVPEVMDGMGMMAFMRDSKLLRDPQPKQHHPRKQLTPEEIEKAETEQAQATLAAYLMQARLLLDNVQSESSTLIPRIKKSEWLEASQVTTALSKTLRDLATGLHKEAKPMTL